LRDVAPDADLGFRLAGGALFLLGGGPLDVGLHGLDGRLLRSHRLAADAPLSLAGLPKGLAWIRVRDADRVTVRPLLIP
jgi:hypothetical protein